MRLTHLPLQLFTSFFLWFIGIFITTLSIFFLLRVFSYYLIGGHFLFSYVDVVKALKIGGYCSLLCNAVSWFLRWRNK
ncbi:Uncharacterised protein [Yokenella regensburgei]|jgi:hypothetical protein|uniref:Uncharacterized protein n=1 Tax=Yokenella regensburgei TaxID=158877 RepID=A0AB38FUQ2_9ENTR|nr:Uncharacterised protein [Yokenella regensburgei]SQA96180.1 Uncharacterised protein [Yokenella regensburgei]SUQ04302.1 Uncharacterised protein [Yokenella regensburgei]